MQGMLKQERRVPVFKNGGNRSIIYRAGSTNCAWTLDDFTTLESVTSFRSNAGYVRAVNNGAVILPDDISGMGRSLGDTGHEFEHTKQSIFCDVMGGQSSLAGYENRFYNGPVIPSPYLSYDVQTQGDPADVNFMKKLAPVELQKLGSELISRAQPLQSQANILQTVVEVLREGLPSAIFGAIAGPSSLTKRGTVKALGSDYLNVVFGISPLVRDLDKVIKAAQRIDSLVSQLVRDSGNQIYRKRALPDTEVTHPEIQGDPYRFFVRIPNENRLDPGNYPLSGTDFQQYWIPGRMRNVTYTRDTTKTWFSGSFTYFVDNLRMPSGIRDFFNEMNGRSETPIEQIVAEYLLGVGEANVSKGLVWELTPFSWLVDWFVNVGTVLDNRRVFDELGLVMNYGYVMREETRTSTTTSYSEDLRRTWSSQIRSTRKRRIRANPFGFGLSDGNLSGYQMSILGALATNGLGIRR